MLLGAATSFVAAALALALALSFPATAPIAIRVGAGGRGTAGRGSAGNWSRQWTCADDSEGGVGGDHGVVDETYLLEPHCVLR